MEGKMELLGMSILFPIIPQHRFHGIMLETEKQTSHFKIFVSFLHSIQYQKLSSTLLVSILDTHINITSTWSQLLLSKLDKFIWATVQSISHLQRLVEEFIIREFLKFMYGKSEFGLCGQSKFKEQSTASLPWMNI